MRSPKWELPGGYIDDSGERHRSFDLRPLTGRDEEILAGSVEGSASQVSQILSLFVTRIGSIFEIDNTIIRKLLVADRQYLMLMLRQFSFGDTVEAVMPCPVPRCGQRLDLDFKISEIPITQCDVKKNYHIEITSEDLEHCGAFAEVFNEYSSIQFSLPTGEEQEVIGCLGAVSDVEKASHLLARCVTRIGSNNAISLDFIRNLPSFLRRKLEVVMEGIAPSLELTMTVQCPECDNSFEIPFDLQDFFFGEIKLNLEILQREVHYLAFHYHWSEKEILEMSKNKRQSYITILSDEIETLNETSE